MGRLVQGSHGQWYNNPCELNVLPAWFKGVPRWFVAMLTNPLPRKIIWMERQDRKSG